MESLGDHLRILKKVPWWAWVSVIALSIIFRIWILTALTVGAFVVFIVLWIIGIIAAVEIADND